MLGGVGVGGLQLTLEQPKIAPEESVGGAATALVGGEDRSPARRARPRLSLLS